MRAQVNFRQLRAETAGNRYLRRFLPASEGIFTCGSVYLRPSQVILHAPVLQCSPSFCHQASSAFHDKLQLSAAAPLVSFLLIKVILKDPNHVGAMSSSNWAEGIQIEFPQMPWK